MLLLFKMRLLGELGGRVTTIIHQAAYLGSSYACLSLATLALRYFLARAPRPIPVLARVGQEEL